MNLNRTRAIAKKEFKHLFRDIRMLLILLLFPVFLLGIFGYAVNFDVHHIKIVVYDEENSEISREFISSLTKSTYFDLVGYITNDFQIKEILDKKKAQCVVVIPKDFSRKFFAKLRSLLYDPSQAFRVNDKPEFLYANFNKFYLSEIIKLISKPIILLTQTMRLNLN